MNGADRGANARISANATAASSTTGIMSDYRIWMGSVLALLLAMRGFALVNGQIQYGSARWLTPAATPIWRRFTRLTDPARFPSQRRTSRSVVLLFGGSLL